MSPPGATRVFLSVGRTTTRSQEEFVRQVEGMLEEQGLKACTVGRSEFTNDNPIDLVVDTMRDCAGAIILAFERTHIQTGTEGVALLEGDDQPRVPIADRRLTTPWNHIEGAMAFMLGKPILVLCEKGVHQDGMLDRACGYMVQTVELKTAVLAGKEFRQIFAAWTRKVKAGGRRKLPGGPGTWTIAETMGALTWSQLATIVGTMVAVLGATAKGTLALAALSGPALAHASTVPPTPPVDSRTDDDLLQNATLGQAANPPNRVRIRASHVDDFGIITLNGAFLTEADDTAEKADTDWIDLTPKLHPGGSNTLEFLLKNSGVGGWGFRFQVEAGTTVYDSGIVRREACPCGAPVLNLAFVLEVDKNGNPEGLAKPILKRF
jgi:hypothetical protein